MGVSAQKDRIECRQQNLINKGSKYFVVAYGDNLQWVEREIDAFLSMWHNKVDIENIASFLRRPLHEIKYLIAYLESPKNAEDRQTYAKECKYKFKGEAE